VISRCAAAVDLGDLLAAGFLLDHGLELVHREGNPTRVGLVHELQMQARYHCGDFEGVEKHFKAGRKLFDDPGFRQSPGGLVTAFGSASLNAWILGRIDLARERIAQMLAMVDANNPYRLSLFGIFEGRLRLCTKEYDVAEIVAERALGLSEQHRFSSVTADARCLLGEARAQLGNPSEGIRLIRRGIAVLLQMGAGLGIGALMATLASAQGLEGAVSDGIATIEQALSINPEERSHRSEMFRIRGELRLKQEQPELAKADFREAIAVACNMNAKSFELRATMSLVRLLAKHNHRDEARTMLAEIYNWFTEGFDTADLIDAKALLDQLGA